MTIGFDAKRAFQNGTGLGHYSRTLINSLAEFFPQHRYGLYAPKRTDRFDASASPAFYERFPDRHPFWKNNGAYRAWWRTYGLLQELKNDKVELFHGLSHELPVGIENSGIPSIVTMHDLIFERYPAQYNWIDRKIYRKKFLYAAKAAQRVIAISEQTKRDLIDLYGVPDQKISVCYQSCHPHFKELVAEEKKEEIRRKYRLPDQFFLYVGSIIERKNLLNICRAVKLLRDHHGLSIPLVAIGNGTSYKKRVQDYIRENNLENLVILMADRPESAHPAFQSATDFPAIYQLASAMIYPSYFEGFGIPVLEALWSQTPVVTSKVSCMPETGGDAAWYVDPDSAEEMADALLTIFKDPQMASGMRERGLLHAAKFSPQNCAEKVMEVYNQVV